MPGVRINFAEVESSFEPLPEGQYDCVIETVEVRDSQSSDNDYLNWELKVLDDEFEGRRLWMITSLGEKALWKLKDTLVALELIEEDDEIEVEWEEGVDITSKEGPRVTFPDLDGLGCTATVYHEMYEGRVQTRVREITAGGGAPSRSRPAKKAAAPKKAAPKKAAAKKTTSSKSSSSSSRTRSNSGSGARKRSLR